MNRMSAVPSRPPGPFDKPSGLKDSPQELPSGRPAAGDWLGLTRRREILAAVALAASLLPGALPAEETGSGHYMPGATATFIDALPGKPAWVIANGFTYYDGQAGAGQSLRFGGQLTLGARATAYADTVLGLYETPLRLLGGNYAAGFYLPYVWMEVEGQVQRDGPFGGTQTVTVRDTADGLGDLFFYPFMLGWTNGPDLRYDLRLAVYAPTGPYEVGRLANTGRNYWTFEPGCSITWLSTKIGTELSLFAAYDVSTENHDTDYQNGDVVHLDGTVAQHLPLFGGFVGIGANAFYYQQVTGDTGSGASLGSFQGRAVGVGPVLSYARKLGKAEFAAEIKWLPELDVENRLKGDYLWVKLGFVF